MHFDASNISVNLELFWCSVLVITIIIIIIFGTVVDPSFSGQVSHLLSLIFFSLMSSQNLFVNIFFLSGKYYPNSNRLQTPRRRRKEATSGLLHFVSLNNTQYTLDSYNLFYMKTQGTQVDASMGVTRRSSSSLTEGSSIEIPDFLKKKGRSCYPRL